MAPTTLEEAPEELESPEKTNNNILSAAASSLTDTSTSNTVGNQVKNSKISNFQPTDTTPSTTSSACVTQSKVVASNNSLSSSCSFSSSNSSKEDNRSISPAGSVDRKNIAKDKMNKSGRRNSRKEEEENRDSRRNTAQERRELFKSLKDKDLSS